MRTLAFFLTVAGLLLAAAPSAWAQGSSPLEYKMSPGPATERMLLQMSSTLLRRSEGRPVGIKGTPPEAKGELTYFVCELSSRPFIIAMDSASPPNLFVARDGGKDLSAAKAAHRTRMADSYPQDEWQYGPVVLNAPGGAEGSVSRAIFINNYGDGVLMLPAGYAAGQVKVGKKTYKVALLDGNFDGRFTPSIQPLEDPRTRDSSDCIAMDLDADGSFGFSHHVMEIQPLTKIVRLDGKYYEIKAAADGSSIEALPAKPRMGTLAITGAMAEMLLLGIASQDYLPGPKADWQVAAGRYTCRQIKLTATDKNGDKWTLQTIGETGRLHDFEIKPDETLSVALGAPLAIKTDVQQQGSRGIWGTKIVTVGFTIVGKAGEEYSPGAEKNGTRVPAPKITIYNEKDEVLASGNFEYG